MSTRTACTEGDLHLACQILQPIAVAGCIEHDDYVYLSTRALPVLV